MSDLRALSIRQPWAYLILHGGKDVENRPWRTNYRGEMLIHAGLKVQRDREQKYGLDSESLVRGAIVGKVTIWR